MNVFKNPVEYNTALSHHEQSIGALELESYPRLVQFTITDACNQHCRFCFGSHKKASAGFFCDKDAFVDMKWLKFVKTISIAGSGEALMHPHYSHILKTIRENAPHSNIQLYTNGLGLHGKNMDATLEYASSVHISQNALSKAVYERIIIGGNHERSLKNLRELGQRKPRHMEVEITYVATKETIGETKKFIDLAAHYGFTRVGAKAGLFNGDTSETGMPEDSFAITYADYIDVDAMKAYAAELGVEILLNDKHVATQSCAQGCYQPWWHGFFATMEGGWTFALCCGDGSFNISASHAAVADFKRVWNHERCQLVRRTVNSEELLANKACTYCRTVARREAGAIERGKKLVEILRVPKEGFFPPLHIA